MRCIFVSVIGYFLLSAQLYPAYAADIAFQSKVVLGVGQSIILKGVRGRCSDTTAPMFSSLRELPILKTGVLSDGGAGTVQSDSCKGRVPARAMRFTARKSGKERVTIYKDSISITVK